ncbi:N-acetylmuramoyl-L-alanine amidase family protein [Clostridium sp.]|uniref:peptidoglycan recognition protein family protein n=1 Tax=Clostridium sp. TaxID=1506 RepID=UPI001D2AF40A|nr:N-acetylmuramoyl-L-alanine amidase family protein [Clostridium sp.]MBS5307800.1 N-acetylmuramoyl-L-alanine amidase family protein [Clostridium sp.]
MKIIQKLISSNRYDIKCPYPMEAEGIVIHNTANDASAENEIAYMQSNNNEVSFHIAVDDVCAIQGLPLNRNAWHTGDGGSGRGNRKYIGIEICYSRSGGERFDKAERNCAELVAEILKERGWGIDKVKKHQDFSGKYCPHRTLDMGWQRFLNMIQAELNKLDTDVKSSFPLPLKMSSDAMSYDGEVKIFNKGDLLTADAENQWAYAIELDGKRCWVEKANVKLLSLTDERYRRFRLQVIDYPCRVWIKEIKPFYKDELITARFEMSGYYALDIDGVRAYIRKNATMNR